MNANSDAEVSPATPIADVHQLVANKLAATRQRYTATRHTIVEALRRSDGPLTVAGILNCSDRLTQSSTYRNLALLEAATVVHKIVVSDDFARFELTEEVTGYHHHHLICEQCGAIVDVNLSKKLEQTLEAELAARARQIGFEETHHRVDLVGICASCQKPTVGTE